MFTFPNKDRRFEWISKAVTSGSSSVSITDNNGIPSYSTRSDDVVSREDRRMSIISDYVLEENETVKSPCKVFVVNEAKRQGYADGSETSSLDGVHEPRIRDGWGGNENGLVKRVAESTGRDLQYLGLARNRIPRVPLTRNSVGPSHIRGVGFQGEGENSSKNAHQWGEDREDDKPSKFLETYYDMMYYLGMSTYKTWKSMKTHTTQVFRVIDGLQKVCFLGIATESLFMSGCQIKFKFIGFLVEKGYSVFIVLAFQVATFLAKVYAINLLGFKRKKTNKMMVVIKEYEANYYLTDNESIKRFPWIWKLVPTLALLSLVFSLMTAVFGTGFLNWSMQKQLLENSIVLREDIMLWNPMTMENDTQQLRTQYGSNLTTTSLLFGSIVLLRAFASYLQLGVMLDLVVVIGIVMFLLVQPLMKEVKQVTSNAPLNNLEECNRLQSRREDLWLKFQELKLVVKEMNVVYDPLLKMMHIGNLLMYVVFLVLFIYDDNLADMIIAIYGFNTLKAEIAYYTAGKIAEQNDAIRAWIRNWSLYTGKIRIGEVEMDVTVILDELSKEPIGLGTGNNFINHTFHFKLLGLVGSIFFSMVDDLGEE